jgi:hypothetical protein
MKPMGYRAAVWAGLLPILAVNAAYLINVWQGSEACFPYLQGCQSVSRGLRSGPGLWLFKALAVPTGIAMVLTWLQTHRFLEKEEIGTRMHRQMVQWLGLIGAFFFLVYATWLGTEGDIYRWLRRYGVVFYFAGTGLAHLLLMAMLQKSRASLEQKSVAVWRYAWLVSVTWLLGVASAFKRQMVDDPDFLDRVENALEWDFSLALALAFVALAPLLAPTRAGHATQQPPRGLQ